MKKQFLLLIITVLLLSATAAFGQKKEISAKPTNSKAFKEKLEKSASEYLKGILDGDAEKVFKYIHPDLVKEVGGKAEVLKSIKGEFKIYKDEKFIFDNFGIVEDGVKPSNSTVIIEAIVKIPEGKVTFDGHLKGKLENGKWYFFNIENESIIQSLGLKELDDETV